MKILSLQVPLCICLLLLGACEKAEVVVYNDEALANESQTANWLAYGRTHNERRFSPSDQIDTGNVADLNVDWFLDLPQDIGLVSTPLVVDGTLRGPARARDRYVSNVTDRAVDAVTGFPLEFFMKRAPKPDYTRNTAICARVTGSSGQ